MAEKKPLNDRFLKGLKPAPAGTRREIWDADTSIPGFGIRIHDIESANPSRHGKAGRITFMLYARFSPGAASTRRTIGTYGAISLKDARRIAGEWRSLIDQGIDPAVVVAKAREKAEREEALRVHHAFSVVAETFIADKLSQERDSKNAERNLRNVFVAAWRDRPVSEITPHDVLAIINPRNDTHRNRRAR